MAKRFKLRICKVITTTLQSCRSKDPSNLPQDPVPSFTNLNKPAAVKDRSSSLKHHLSSAFISIGRTELPPSTKQTSEHKLNPAAHTQEFKWQKEEKWHVVANIYHHPSPRRKMHNSSEDDDLTFAQPTPQPPSASDKKKRRGKKKIRSNVPSRLRISTSSADSGWFSSDGGGGGATAGDERDEEETETLVSSSISLSCTDSSSEFNPNKSQLQPIQETQLFTTSNLPHRRTNKRKVSKRTKHGVVKPPPPAALAEAEIPARLSMFKKLIPCTVDGKVKESFAIVKRSEDPYEDFKNSMMDMILEKQMFDQKDLEQLLECFLSLNSRHYHEIIVQAFTEIWDAIFAQPGSKHSVQHYPRVSRRASF
ncbi:hypothetical protein BUALT_Bualt04G0075900 [Buddleja alternifolia]|uniref:Transcription repressor n=1 Tax=Buddleja alternifolia TaxID=168488 RepID=A0AAV6XV95_9LAMI|nr:hypothetical protein BUALT_Bualt04G0075900 [Buddleja alternifolia]